MTRPLRTSGRRFLLRPLNVIFGAPSHIALLRSLSQAARGLTGREVAVAAEVAQRAALDGLGRLEDAGIVRRTPAGRAFVYELRREHALVRDGLLPLLDLEAKIRSDVFARLRATMEKDVVSGCVFGSVARGEDRPASDLDILAIVDGRGASGRLERRVAAIFEGLHRDYQLRPSLLVMTRSQFIRGYRAGQDFMTNVVREAEAFAGRPLRALIND